MIFYQDAEGEWYATQADAKKKSPSFKQLDVPTDKYGLRDWLIWYRAELLGPARYKPVIEVTETVTPITLHELPTGADAVMQWVLDAATPAQIEQLFAALGARFHELRTQGENHANRQPV